MWCDANREFAATFEAGAAAGFGSVQGASRGLEHRDSGIEVLVRGRYPCIADAGGGAAQFGYALSVFCALNWKCP